MKTWLAIGLGSFAGGVLRYYLSCLVQTKPASSFPFGTLVVNIIGCLLMGIVFGLHLRNSISSETQLFLATGLLGGFTTFSAFSLEAVTLMKAGQYGQCLIYILASVLVGILATTIGIYLMKNPG